jgi:hypothetical protein
MDSTADPVVRPLRREDFHNLVKIYWELYDERDSEPLVGFTVFGSRPPLADEERMVRTSLASPSGPGQNR